MSKSIHDPRYQRFIKLLVDARREAGLTQRDVAARLKKPPSYVAKIEALERRVDVVELFEFLDVLGVSPTKFVASLTAMLRKKA